MKGDLGILFGLSVQVNIAVIYNFAMNSGLNKNDMEKTGRFTAMDG